MKLKLAFWTFIGTVLLLPTTLFAQTRPPIPNPRPIGPDKLPLLLEQTDSSVPFIFTDPEGATGVLKVRTLVSEIAGWLLGILTAFGIVMLIFAGYMFITASGNEEKLNKAKNMVKWVVIGLIVALLSWTVIDLIIKRWPTGPKAVTDVTNTTGVGTTGTQPPTAP